MTLRINAHRDVTTGGAERNQPGEADQVGLKCFEDWCQDKYVVNNFKTVSKQQVSNALRLL